MMVPCYRGGHHCRWPACPLDCDGRVGHVGDMDVGLTSDPSPVPMTPGPMKPKARGGGANNAKKTHCPKGHPYSGNNLILRKSGKRSCKTCERLAAKAWDKRTRDENARIRAQRDNPQWLATH